MSYIQEVKITEAGPTYKQTWAVKSPAYLDAWVAESLEKISTDARNFTTLLDVGAGTGPYRQKALGLGFFYRGHDFAKYAPCDESPGLQNREWFYTELEITCDLLLIPAEADSGVVLCTEVLEHVPDPVAAFDKLWDLVSPGGSLLVSVPFLSLMHQAPYWFSSGLGPFWFAHHARRVGCVDYEITVHGDYFDLVRGELARLLIRDSKFRKLLFGPLVLLAGFALALCRKLAPPSVRQMGGLGVTFSGLRPRSDAA